ncbi:hypothetical protein RFI_03480, partial [Reticulomyxa filosa]
MADRSTSLNGEVKTSFASQHMRSMKPKALLLRCKKSGSQVALAMIPLWIEYFSYSYGVSFWPYVLWERYNCTILQIGLIFASFPVSSLLVSSVAHKIIHRTGLIFSILAGLFFHGIALMLLGVITNKHWLTWCEDTTTLVVVSVVLRFIQGVCSGFSVQAMNHVMLQIIGRDKLSHILHTANDVATLGVIMGPICGALLYRYGVTIHTYNYAFIVIGVVVLVLTVITAVLLIPISKKIVVIGEKTPIQDLYRKCSV